MNRVWLLGEVCGHVRVETVRTRNGPMKKARVTLRVKKSTKPEVIPVTAWGGLAERVERSGIRPGQTLSVDGCLHSCLGEDDNQSRVSVLEVFMSDFNIVEGEKAS
ncbi:MAG: single-stranded DNA-binding protein [Anaerolineae bacterium]